MFPHSSSWPEDRSLTPCWAGFSHSGTRRGVGRLSSDQQIVIANHLIQPSWVTLAVPSMGLPACHKLQVITQK